MTQAEAKKIFLLVTQFFPHAKQNNPTTELAWTLALEKYPYDDVKKSVLTYASKNKFFPDLADITGHLVMGVTPQEWQEKFQRTKGLYEALKNKEAQTDDIHRD